MIISFSEIKDSLDELTRNEIENLLSYRVVHQERESHNVLKRQNVHFRQNLIGFEQMRPNVHLDDDLDFYCGE